MIHARDGLQHFLAAGLGIHLHSEPARQHRQSLLGEAAVFSLRLLRQAAVDMAGDIANLDHRHILILSRRCISLQYACTTTHHDWSLTLHTRLPLEASQEWDRAACIWVVPE